MMVVVTQAEDDLLKTYYADARAMALPEGAEAARLLAQARAGDDRARTRFIQGLLEYTAGCAVAHAGGDRSELDAIQEANLVLMRLVNDVDVADPRAALPSALGQHFGQE